MTDNTINKDDRCLAILALSLQKQKGKVDIDAGPTPSDEELNAVYATSADDSNHRRTQILQHITQDKTVYQRWLNIVDENHTIHNESSEAITDTLSLNKNDSVKIENTARNNSTPTNTSNTNGWQEKVLSWIGNWFKPISLAGSGIAVAAVFSFFIFNPSFSGLYDKEIDALYAQNSYTPDNLLNLQLPTRGTDWQKSSEIMYTSAQLTIARGIQQGWNNLGEELSGLGSKNLQRIEAHTVSSASDARKKDNATLFSLGRLTALAHIQCKTNNDNAQFLQQASPLYQQLSSQLTNINEKMLTPIKTLNQQNIDTSKKLCLAANMVTEQLHIQY